MLRSADARLRHSRPLARLCAGTAVLPVPVRARADGWTLERQGRFIGLLAETGCVAAAARGVGMSRVAAYQLRARAGAESFVRAWDAVLAIRAASHDGGPRPRKRNFTPSELPEAAIDGR